MVRKKGEIIFIFLWISIPFTEHLLTYCKKLIEPALLFSCVQRGKYYTVYKINSATAKSNMQERTHQRTSMFRFIVLILFVLMRQPSILRASRCHHVRVFIPLQNAIAGWFVFCQRTCDVLCLIYADKSNTPQRLHMQHFYSFSYCDDDFWLVTPWQNHMIKTNWEFIDWLNQ